MIKTENYCVNCEKPCLFEACPYYKVERHYCYRCGEAAEFEIDGEDYCKYHAEILVNEYFESIDLLGNFRSTV